MKINKINNISYELDKDLQDYSIREISEYCKKQSYCGDCIFKFLCKLPSGNDRDMVDPYGWKNSACDFQNSEEFQFILEANYKKGK